MFNESQLNQAALPDKVLIHKFIIVNFYNPKTGLQRFFRSLQD